MPTAPIIKSAQEIDFPELMQRILNLLTEKEQDILKRRFSLQETPKETLDKIGKSYDITRERVRQIEAVAIRKLTRISMDPAMRAIHKLAFEILTENGDIMAEDQLVSQMILNMNDNQKIDRNSVVLAMRVSDNLTKQDKNQQFNPFWRTKELSMADVRALLQRIHKVLKKQQENVLVPADIAEALNESGAKVTEATVASILYIDKRFLKTGDGWGLMSCRLINPKSIKDRIIITLRNNAKPLHFSEIIRAVLEEFPAVKKVTTQAIHNELIRHDEFVLVGRGLYGLKEWNMTTGTVCDVIIQVMREHGEPMKRQDIINKVLEKREIRVGTISLNLQKYEFFQRVGRAVYIYDEKLDKRRRHLKAIRKANEAPKVLKKRGRKPKAKKA